MRIRNWYFQGWERRENPNGKSELVYTGERYTFPGGIGAYRKRTLLLGAVLTALYLAVALLPPAGGMWRPAAIPQLLELIPLIYLVLGMVCLARAREPLTFRDWYATWRRIRNAALWSILFTGSMAVMEIVYLLFVGEEISLGAELLYLLGELGCTGLSAALARYLAKHPCIQSAPERDKEK